MPRRKTPPTPHETIAQERDRRAHEALVQDLEASLAHDPMATTRAERVRELAALPRTPIHPLELFLRERGISRTKGAEYLGLKPSEVTAIVQRWKVPEEAELLAKALGFRRVEEIFPKRVD